MHCLTSKAFTAPCLCIALAVGTAAHAQSYGPLASEQTPAWPEIHYAAQAARPAMNETSEESEVLASEQGLEKLDSERVHARQADDTVVPQAMQARQPLASDSPAAEPGQ